MGLLGTQTLTFQGPKVSTCMGCFINLRHLVGWTGKENKPETKIHEKKNEKQPKQNPQNFTFFVVLCTEKLEKLLPILTTMGTQHLHF